jgi:hypothetical protein
MKVARGCRRRGSNDRLQVVVRLDDDTFAEVRSRAQRECTSFGEQVRLLVEWGLEAANETAERK